MQVADARQRFKRWYAKPLRRLKNHEAFVALAVCCFLYERYAEACRKDRGEENCDLTDKEFVRDFDTDQRTARAFRRVIRNGLAHGGMGELKEDENTLPKGWWLSNDFEKPVEIKKRKSDGVEVLRIQPWTFRDKVLELWEARPELLTVSNTYPWASVIEISPDDWE